MKSIPQNDSTIEPILTKPSEWLVKYLKYLDAPLSYEAGRISVGLELESQARIFEELEGTSLIALNKEEIAAALRTLLRSLGIDDDVRSMYDQLVWFRAHCRPTFSAYDGDENAHDSLDGTDEALLRFQSHSECTLAHDQGDKMTPSEEAQTTDE